MPQGVKILIVDDDSFLLDMYALKFKEGGYDVDTSSSAQEALQKFRGGARPDVLLFDLVMPGLDGFALLKALHDEKLNEGLISIALSNLDQEEDIKRGFALGADGYIVKASATPTEVVNKVFAIIKEKKGKAKSDKK